jgi:antitoxin (DNA-binding transcriptional repressor) of toxin-antitoxin stability system
MNTLPLSYAKTNFSALIKSVDEGEEIAISIGKKKRIVAVIVPYGTWKRTGKRQLGTLAKQGSVEFLAEYSISDMDLTEL